MITNFTLNMHELIYTAKYIKISVKVNSFMSGNYYEFKD